MSETNAFEEFMDVQKLGSVLTGKGGMTMTNREEVIKWMEKCRRCECDDCTEKGASQAPWDCPAYDDFIDSAIAMLKEQEAKCLTKAELDDLNENQFVWIEERTGYLYCLQIIGIYHEKTGVSDIQFNEPTSYVERSTNRYGKSYRIWTNKPTEEQRQAVKWNA